MKSENPLLPFSWLRLFLIATALCFLVLIYLFQRFNFFLFFLSFFTDQSNYTSYFVFIFNKTLRLVLNDACCFVMISALFKERKYVKVAFWVFLFELLVLLPVYFVLKLYLEGDTEISSPLISQLHRLIINPTLMLLLMIAFFYQWFKESKKSNA